MLIDTSVYNFFKLDFKVHCKYSGNIFFL